MPEGGKVMLGGRVVATKSDWSLKATREPLDATVFGESKTFLVGPPTSISGTFNGRLDALAGSWLGWEGDDGSDLLLHATVVPAWWGRLKHALLRDEWPTYVVARGLADVQSTTGPDGAVRGAYRFLGPVTINVAPMSRLERLWDRLLHPRRWRS